MEDKDMKCPLCGHPSFDVSEATPEMYRRFCYKCHKALLEAGYLGQIILHLLKKVEKMESVGNLPNGR